MKTIVSSLTALLLTISSFSAQADSKYTGKISSKQSLSNYQVVIEGQPYQVMINHPIDLEVGQTVFFNGVKDGKSITVNDHSSVGIIRPS